MGTHIHVGTANRRNALALLLLALVMLFNTAVPAMAQKNMTGALKKKNLLGKGSFSKAAAAVMVGSALYQSFDKQKSKTATKAVTPSDSPDPNVKLTSGRQVTDLYYDDGTDNTARQLQQLRLPEMRQGALSEQAPPAAPLVLPRQAEKRQMQVL